MMRVGMEVLVTVKPWWQSKTIILNVVVLLLLVLSLPEIKEVIPVSFTRYILAVTAVLNVLLRFITTQPIVPPAEKSITE